MQEPRREMGQFHFLAVHALGKQGPRPRAAFPESMRLGHHRPPAELLLPPEGLNYLYRGHCKNGGGEAWKDMIREEDSSS